ncbi:MAG: hypothetical protein IPG45_27985 [Deltaproteobacteria bacterium]|nr:hypothetical protein [Deltaproteobacteria bacterium]
MASLLPEADEVSASFKESVEFFEGGGNWSGVMCPVCGADAEGWWNPAMDRAHAGGFSDLMATADCCGASVSLNELRYVWPAAFGSFCLEAMNPNVSELPVAVLRQLEKVLGTPLRALWMHV